MAIPVGGEVPPRAFEYDPAHHEAAIAPENPEEAALVKAVVKRVAEGFIHIGCAAAQEGIKASLQIEVGAGAGALVGVCMACSERILIRSVHHAIDDPRGTVAGVSDRGADISDRSGDTSGRSADASREADSSAPGAKSSDSSGVAFHSAAATLNDSAARVRGRVEE